MALNRTHVFSTSTCKRLRDKREKLLAAIKPARILLHLSSSPVPPEYLAIDTRDYLFNHGLALFRTN